MDAMLVAGPAIRNTKAVPGDRPFIIKAVAIGIEPMAHTYMGIATNKTINMVIKGGRLREVKNESGTNTVIKAPIIKPKVSHFPMFCIKSTKL